MAWIRFLAGVHYVIFELTLGIVAFLAAVDVIRMDDVAWFVFMGVGLLFTAIFWIVTHFGIRPSSLFFPNMYTAYYMAATVHFLVSFISIAVWYGRFRDASPLGYTDVENPDALIQYLILFGFHFILFISVTLLTPLMINIQRLLHSRSKPPKSLSSTPSSTPTPTPAQMARPLNQRAPLLRNRDVP